LPTLSAISTGMATAGGNGDCAIPTEATHTSTEVHPAWTARIHMFRSLMKSGAV
jgi:hypothetical protein